MKTNLQTGYSLSRRAGCLKIKVPSKKNCFLEWYSLLISIIFFAVAICSPVYFIFFEDKVLAAILSLVVALGFFLLHINAFYWLKKGYEMIAICKTLQSIEVYRVGLFLFDKNTITLPDSTFEMRTKTSRIPNPYSENSLVYGVGGGKIIIRNRKKVYEFGVSINEIQANELISEIHNFLREF